MANEVVGIDIKADVRSLRTQIREATQEFVRLQESGKATSQELANAAKRVANLKDAVADARSTIDAFNPDQKFRAFSQSIQGVAGGFAAAQGALALFGVESENVQKQLLKVQAALAFSEGLNTVLDSIQGFKNLALVLKTQVLSAFSTLRGAIIASGIGALAVGLGLLVANFDKVKDAILRAVPGLARFGTIIGNVVEKITDFVGITSEADRALEKLTSRNKRLGEELENRIKILSAQGGKETEIHKLKLQQTEVELNTLRAKLKTTGKLTEEEYKQFRDLKNAQLVQNAEYIAKQNEKDKKANEQSKQLINERLEAEISASKQRIDRLKEIDDLLLTEDEKKLAQLTDRYNQDLLLFEGNEKAKKLIREKYEQDYLKIVEFQDIKTLKDKEINTGKEFDLKASLNKKLDKLAEENSKRAIQYDKITNTQKIQLAGEAFTILSGLADSGTDLQKGLALAQVAIDTGVAISGLTASTSAPSPDNLATGGISGFAKYAAGIIKILANIAQAKNIIQSASRSSTQAQTPNVSTTAPIVPQFTEQQAVALNSETLNKMNNVAMRAYVVESDISGSQQRIKRLENSATF